MVSCGSPERQTRRALQGPTIVPLVVELVDDPERLVKYANFMLLRDRKLIPLCMILLTLGIQVDVRDLLASEQFGAFPPALTRRRGSFYADHRDQKMSRTNDQYRDEGDAPRRE